MNEALKRSLLVVGVIVGAGLMAWQVSSALQQSQSTAVRALQTNEQRDARLALEARVAAAQAFSASSQAVRTQQLLAAIQLSRKRDCLAANARHVRTLGVFDRLLRQAARTARGSQRAQLRRSRVATLKLLDAIVPRYDCRNP